MNNEEKIYSLPRIGEKAPSFKAKTTQGEINFPEDFAGKWVVLFSHPADFTPVCTTEFMTFASMSDEFKKINTELVGLSIDGIASHIAWLRKIRELKWNNLENIEEPRSKGKALVGNLKDYWRYRIGDYRLITKIDDGKLLIIALELKHRKEVYE